MDIDENYLFVTCCKEIILFYSIFGIGVAQILDAWTARVIDWRNTKM